MIQLSLSLSNASPVAVRASSTEKPTRKRANHGDRCEFTCHTVDRLMEVSGLLENHGYVRVDDMGRLGHFAYLVLDDLGGYLVIWRERPDDDGEAVN